MRIAITVESFHSQRKYLEYYLARELVRMGHDVHVFSFSTSNKIQQIETQEGFILHNITVLSSLGGYHFPSLASARHIISFVKQTAPEIIHCQPLFSPLSILLIIIGYQRNARIVGSLISGEYKIETLSSVLKYVVSKLITEQFVSKFTKSIFVKSNGLKKIVLQLYKIDKNKLHQIPLGVDPEVFSFNENSRRLIRKGLNVTEDDILILCPGRLVSSKRVDSLINAIAPVIIKNPRVVLLIKGEGDKLYLGHLKRLCESFGISDNVIFQEFSNHLDLPAFYSASDFAVWPGGASISMVEAASCNLPLISMKSPIEEYIITPENGFTFEPGNIAELREYIIRLIENAQLRKIMGDNSRKLVETKFNWKSIVNQYLQIYRETIEFTSIDSN